MGLGHGDREHRVAIMKTGKRRSRPLYPREGRPVMARAVMRRGAPASGEGPRQGPPARPGAVPSHPAGLRVPTARRHPALLSRQQVPRRAVVPYDPVRFRPRRTRPSASTCSRDFAGGGWAMVPPRPSEPDGYGSLEPNEQIFRYGDPKSLYEYGSTNVLDSVAPSVQRVRRAGDTVVGRPRPRRDPGPARALRPAPGARPHRRLAVVEGCADAHPPAQKTPT